MARPPPPLLLLALLLLLGAPVGGRAVRLGDFAIGGDSKAELPDLAGVKAALNSALRGNVDSVVAGVKKRLGEGSSGGRGLRRALQADNMSIMAVLGTSAVPTVPVVAAAPGVQSRTTTTEGGAG